MKKTLLFVLLLGLTVMVALGCQGGEESQQEQKKAEQAEKPPAQKQEKVMPKLSRAGVDSVTFKAGEKPKVKLETTLGDIVVELWPDVAPLHCKNFVYLTENGFYDSLKIHRVISGFVLQTGDPMGDGTGGPGYTIEAEFSDKKHVKGTLSMARAQNPNSAGSQFFICLAPTPNLDNKYTVFGQAVEGLDVIDKFNAVETKPNAHGEKSDPVEPLYLIKATLLDK